VHEEHTPRQHESYENKLKISLRIVSLNIEQNNRSELSTGEPLTEGVAARERDPYIGE
jgi:hypothetical protein